MKKALKNTFKRSVSLFSLWYGEQIVINRLIKPETLNLNANDFCNSKCTMCNIWKQKKSYEVSYNDLKIIFSDPFYSEIKHVGITGGEPTLRKDLPSLFRACIEFLPKLEGLSIITNCIKAKQVENQLYEINNLCKKEGIIFSVMVSLDGVGETHDKIRGVKGNYSSTIEVIKYVKEQLQIPVSFGATISKDNVWEIDELLEYAKSNNLYGRFRVAEFIKRLYNNDRKESIRSFTEDEQYHLVLFFEKLKRSYEKKSTFKRTYSSIQSILLNGTRTIGCPYHQKGILLNSKGKVAYCAPKSKIIGNALKDSTLRIYRDNLSELKRIIKEDCNNCIHDYHAPITFKEQIQIEKQRLYSKYLKIEKLPEIINYSFLLKKPILEKGKYSILIVGWYGTETVGDKAILAGIILNYVRKYGEKLNVYIASLYPFVTERTIKELNINAKVVSSKSFEFLKYAKTCNEVIVGGGPLMDLNELYIPLLSFAIAKKYDRKRIVFGCGLGPLTKKKYKKATHKILNLSSVIKLRDFNSVKYAEENFHIKNVQMIGDPAENYIVNVSNSVEVEKKNELALFLRDWTYEYAQEFMSFEEFKKTKVKFEKSLSNFIKKKALEYNVQKIRFYHMHNFVLGNDDRDFSRRFINNYFKNDNRVSYDKKLSTVGTIVKAMKSSKLNICMRFHSVLFAKKLKTNFIAIDYTLGGKILGFLEQNNSLDDMVTIKQIIKEF